MYFFAFALLDLKKTEFVLKFLTIIFIYICQSGVRDVLAKCVFAK